MPSYFPQVRAYHAKVGVIGENGEVSVISTDLPDFAVTDEVLSRIGIMCDANTAGEAVEAIRNGSSVGCSIVDDAVIDEVPVVRWDHRIL